MYPFSIVLTAHYFTILLQLSTCKNLQWDYQNYLWTYLVYVNPFFIQRVIAYSRREIDKCADHREFQPWSLNCLHLLIDWGICSLYLILEQIFRFCDACVITLLKVLNLTAINKMNSYYYKCFSVLKIKN